MLAFGDLLVNRSMVGLSVCPFVPFPTPFGTAFADLRAQLLEAGVGHSELSTRDRLRNLRLTKTLERQ